jgi:acetyl esterase/lipase
VTRRLALGAALLLAASVIAYALAIVLPPTTRLTMAASSRWPAEAPRVVLVALVAVAIAAVAFRRAPRRFAIATAIVTAVAVLFSVTLMTRFVVSAGVSVNPLRGLVFTSMDTPADAREAYAPGLSAVVYRAARADPAPIIVYAHGGGWFQGSATDAAHDMRWFADHGWLVISVDYRLATDAHPTWDEAPGDIGCALVWVRANAARLGGDPGRLVMAGDSAGGNLAIDVAYAAAQGRAQSSCGGTVPVPDAVVVQYPVVDPQNAYDNGFPVEGAEPKMFVTRYLGELTPDRMRAVTSSTYLSPAAPPTLIVEPEQDGLIPTSGVLRFAEQARAAGVDVTLIRLPYANHAYDQIAAGSIGNQAGLAIRRNYLVAQGLG